MRFLAISGSTRATSTNTALLNALKLAAAPEHEIAVHDGLQSLPIFSPDLETDPPDEVLRFARAVADADGLIIASPEYVRSIPGGLKNAIDWLVSREELIGKPIALAHASHRGDDMLGELRRVLSTVSDRFCEEVFLRVHLMKMTPEEIGARMAREMGAMRGFLEGFKEWCGR
jgi:chromate reductase, NAD(P)H dehydrogenase (quinone)